VQYNSLLLRNLPKMSDGVQGASKRRRRKNKATPVMTSDFRVRPKKSLDKEETARLTQPIAEPGLSAAALRGSPTVWTGESRDRGGWVLLCQSTFFSENLLFL